MGNKQLMVRLIFIVDCVLGLAAVVLLLLTRMARRRHYVHMQR